MNLLRLLLPLLLLPVTPALAQTKAEIEQQNYNIAMSVQQQLMACWMLPPGFENRQMALTLSFFGDGTLDEPAVIAPESRKDAAKMAVLADSVLAAVRRCVPFVGLEALGAGRAERFAITVYFAS